MGKISNVAELAISSENKIFYEGKSIQKWWGKTLFYYNPKDKQLYYRNFSLIGLIFHLCGYKKKFNEHGLQDWLKSKDKTIKDVSNNKAAQRVGDVAWKNPILEFSRICKSSDYTSEDIIQMFKEGLNVNTVTDGVNTTALQDACNRGRFTLAKYLIEHGATINTRTLDGDGLVARTPLQHAIMNDHDVLTLLLLEKGADVNSKDSYGDTILQQAISRLNRRGDGYTYDKKEPSNPKNIIRTILTKKVQINAINNRGETALHKACEEGDLEVVKWLIEAGADSTIQSKVNKTAADLARANNHPEIAEYLSK